MGSVPLSPLTGVARASALHSLQFPASRKSLALTWTTCSSPAKASVITSDRFTVSTCARQRGAVGVAGACLTTLPGLMHTMLLCWPSLSLHTYHGPGTVDDRSVLKPKPQLEVGFLWPGGRVLPAHMESPRGQGDRLHHQTLWRVWLNCVGKDRKPLPLCTAVHRGVGIPTASPRQLPRDGQTVGQTYRWMGTH